MSHTSFAMPISTNAIPVNDLSPAHDVGLHALKAWIKAQAADLGFADCGVVHPDNPVFAKQLAALQTYLANGYHGELHFLQDHHDKRANPAQLVMGTQSIISVRMDYLTDAPTPRAVTDNALPNHGIIARYARGRDYHKTMRGRLKTLAERLRQHLATHYPTLAEDFIYRPFSDSAPIFERALAEQAGLGWTGKHTLLIHRAGGSFFVLGELFTSLPLPPDAPVGAHCGSCSACMAICPTQAIVAPYTVDARLCISYLTIELDGEIPPPLRPLMGNRVFGCDDCQLICPWNKFAKRAQVADFAPRHGLDDVGLLTLWAWDEAAFLYHTEGSALRRTGYANFMRNVAVALGNAPFDPTIVTALHAKRDSLNANTQRHVDWALAEQTRKQRQNTPSCATITPDLNAP